MSASAIDAIFVQLIHLAFGATNAARRDPEGEGSADEELARQELSAEEKLIYSYITRFNEEVAKRAAQALEESLAHHRSPTTIHPEVLFPDKFVPCADADTFRCEVLKLLRDWQRYGLPVSEQVLKAVEDEELRWLFWPDPKAKRRRRMQELRRLVDIEEAINRHRGVKQPRNTGLEALARDHDHNSGGALRKAIQAGRVHRRHRRKPRS